MNKPPAFQFYPDDYLGGTRTMTLTQKGAYVDLLCIQWSQGELNQDDIDFVCKSLAPDDKARVMRKFKEVQANVFRNDRLESERQKQLAYREKQSNNGKASAKARFNGGSTVVEPMGEPKLNSPSPSPSPSPISNIEKREREENFSETPPMSRKDFDTMAEMRGVPADCAEWFWNIHDARNWVDQSGNAIRKVEPLLLNAAAKWKQKQHQQATAASTGAQPAKGGTGGTGAAELILRNNELKRVEERMREIRNSYESHQEMNAKHRAEMATLRTRRAELKKILGFNA